MYSQVNSACCIKYQLINNIFISADIVRHILASAAGSGEDICNNMYDNICSNICGNICGHFYDNVGGKALEGYQKV